MATTQISRITVHQIIGREQRRKSRCSYFIINPKLIQKGGMTMKKNIWIIFISILVVLLAAWFVMYNRIEETVDEQGVDIMEDFEVPLPGN